jgi:hypothetical protein
MEEEIFVIMINSKAIALFRVGANLEGYGSGTF